MKPVLEIRNISKKFQIGTSSGPYLSIRESLFKRGKKTSASKDFWALQDVSFDVEPGESIAIVGKNGAGKSTLLKILSKITPPTKGKIVSRGRVASLLEVGTGFHPELTGKENVYLNGSILGLKKSEINARYDEIVDFAGVEQFLNTPLKRYSSGMQLRLAFAVAAHLEPEILVIDEVLAVGDAAFQKKCLGKMNEVSKSGRTILFVSHNMGAVSKLCTRAVLLKNGMVQDIGTTDHIVETYLKDSGVSDNATVIVDNTSTQSSWLINEFTLLQNGKNTPRIVNNQPLTVRILFQGSIAQKISFELVIRNYRGEQLMFIPLGLSQDISYTLDEGQYELTFNINLPFLSESNYSFDVFVVEPFVKRLVMYNQIMEFEVIDSYIEQTGWTFKEYADTGNILLEGHDFTLKQIPGAEISDS